MEILKALSSETDVPESKIMSKCSQAEVVDARYVCVKLLHEQGYYPSKIAELMGITPRYVQYIITNFENRISLSNIMRKDYERTKNILRTIKEINTKSIGS